jgi:hypothetical protein
VAGFGRSPFGRGPFGRSDTGGDLLIERFPTEYFDDSIVLSPGETIRDNNKDPILFLLKTYANSVLKMRVEIENMQFLIDYEKAPLEIVRLMGDMLGLDIDKNDPEFLQRSFLGNASQWLQIKSSKQGYSVRGLASGFDVLVDNFWRVNPIYQSFFPARFQYFLTPKTADPGATPIFHTDQPPGTFVGPPAVEGIDYAKSSYVRVVFSVHEPRRNDVDYNTLLDLVIIKIQDVVAIHHEILAPEFRIYLNVAATATANITIDENASIDGNESFLFDIIPMDVQQLDQNGVQDGYPATVTVSVS